MALGLDPETVDVDLLSIEDTTDTQEDMEVCLRVCQGPAPSVGPAASG